MQRVRLVLLLFSILTVDIRPGYSSFVDPFNCALPSAPLARYGNQKLLNYYCYSSDPLLQEHTHYPAAQTTSKPIATTAAMLPRRILKSFPALSKSEGLGARVRRSIGTPALQNFTPFLMLDHFTITPGSGFPDHPHRGQETITYLLKGSVDHEDFTGSKGTIHEGDLQFMTAGRGIVHAEMPGETSEVTEGLQLWVDLPKELKGCEPRYRDLRDKEIPRVDVDEGRVHVKVISGVCEGVESVRDLAYTGVWILDVSIKPGGRIVQGLPAGWNAFGYVLEGDVEVVDGEKGEKKVERFSNVVFGREGEGVVLSVGADKEEGARVVLVAGKVLDQQIVQYGPFVVSSREEVYEAMMDYQGGKNGFERAKGWRSEIGKRLKA